MRVVFMGTPAFAVPSLRALVDAGFEVVAVVSQPDRPAGRGARLRSPPVKEFAEQAGLRVLQPPTLRSAGTVALLRSLAPEVIVVVAYGQILRREVLDLPPLGCVNVHPSLLPRLRGAAPIQAAIREGLAETGVTIMLMNERLDAGPILAQVRTPIFSDDTAATLGDRLAGLGADLLVDTLPRWASGTIVAQEQDENAATYCRPLRKEDAVVDWTQPASVIARICRAQTPWPGCETSWNGRQVRLLAVEARPEVVASEPVGTVVVLSGERGGPLPGVVTGEGILALRTLQLAGKRPLSGEELLRGYPGFVGARLPSRQGRSSPPPLSTA